MNDAALLWFDFGGDIKVEGGDMLSDKGLVTAVLLSLFVDKRAEIEELPFSETDQRGYWADNVTDRHGSLLWLLEREKVTNETVEKARGYALEALMWLENDGIASSVDVTAARAGMSAISLSVKIHQGSNRQYQYLWDGMKTTNLTIGQTSLEIEFI